MGVAGGAQAGVHRDKALRIQRQPAALQPGRGLCTGGNQRHIAGQPGAAGQLHLGGSEANSGVDKDRDVAVFERACHSALDRLGVVGGERAAAGQQGQRGPGQAVPDGHGQLNAGRPTPDQGQPQCLSLRQLGNPRPQGAEGFNRTHKQTVLAHARHLHLKALPVLNRAGVDREPVKAQHSTVVQRDLAGRRVQRDRTAQNEADWRTGQQRLEFDSTLREPIVAGYEARQHAAVELTWVRRHQGDLRRHGAVARQLGIVFDDMHMGVAGAKQDQVFHGSGAPA